MDAVNLRILEIIHQDARTTYRDVASQVGRSINAVRDRIMRMEKAGTIIGYHASIHPVHENHCMALMYRVEYDEEPPETLWHHPSIAGAYAGPGRFPVMVHLHAGTIGQATDFLQQELYPYGFRIGTLEPMQSQTKQPANYMGDPWQGLDDHDRRLIDLLRVQGLATIRNLASQIELPETTVRDRLHRLESKKVLCGTRAIVDPSALGYSQESWIIARTPASQRAHVAEQLRRNPSIVNVLTSSAHPDRIAIHAVGGPRMRLMDVVEHARFEFGLQVVHFQPVEQVLRANPDDSLPGEGWEKKDQADHLAVTSPESDELQDSMLES